jgi:hypothetical protein
MAMRTTVHSLWEKVQHNPVGAVAKQHNLTTQCLLAMFRQSGLVGEDGVDPSPREIDRQTEMFRRNWSPETEESRRTGRRLIRSYAAG